MFTLDRLPLARVPLLAGPTPIEPWGDAWIKREDRAGTRYGGGKVRKLEWLLGEALEGGGDVLVAGTLGSNNLLATSVYGRASGVHVHAVVAPQADTPIAHINARILHAHAEKLWVADSPGMVPVRLAQASAALQVFGGYPPARFPVGGSNPLGTIGWVGGGLELAGQVEAGDLPPPDRVYVALGSGGIAAGLLVGLRLAGLRSEVVAVRVAGSWLASPLRVRRLAAATLALLRRHGAPRVALDGLRVIDGSGPGYGLQSPAAEAAAARAAALDLDPVYTAKAYAALLAEPGGTRLFVHTANTLPLAPLLESALDRVPPSLTGLLR